MSWNDDSWRDGYDAWKLASPYDDCEEDPCDHEDYDIDILTGEWSCWRCGEHRSATRSEIDMMIQHTADYADYEDRENRRQWWRDLWERVRSIIPRRKHVSSETDDIPF